MKKITCLNLTEAHKALSEIIADMRSDGDCDYGEYVVDMTHAVHQPEHRLECTGCQQSRGRPMSPRKILYR